MHSRNYAIRMCPYSREKQAFLTAPVPNASVGFSQCVQNVDGSVFGGLQLSVVSLQFSVFSVVGCESYKTEN